MNRRSKTGCFTAFSLAGAVLIFATGVPGNSPASPPRNTGGHATARNTGRTGAQILGAVAEPSSTTLDQIREEGEAVMTGTHWSYDPGGRRDPFRSLVENVVIKGEQERPKGVAGMLIAEIDLVGIVTGSKGAVAFVNGSDNRGYFLHPGDHVFDGTIVDIDRAAGRVIFRQKVNDPREIKPYRKVIKKLYSSTEDGQ
ncbi:MAG: hypothetical protein ACE5ID_04725 [Acidobacteriota bacterium]